MPFFLKLTFKSEIYTPQPLQFMNFIICFMLYAGHTYPLSLLRHQHRTFSPKNKPGCIKYRICLQPFTILVMFNAVFNDFFASPMVPVSSSAEYFSLVTNEYFSASEPLFQFGVSQHSSCIEPPYFCLAVIYEYRYIMSSPYRISSAIECFTRYTLNHTINSAKTDVKKAAHFAPDK